MSAVTAGVPVFCSARDKGGGTHCVLSLQLSHRPSHQRSGTHTCNIVSLLGLEPPNNGHIGETSISPLFRGCPFFIGRNVWAGLSIVGRLSTLLSVHYQRFHSLSLLVCQMLIELSGQVVVFDEAHNMEDAAREAASLSLTSLQLEDLCREFTDIRECRRTVSLYGSMKLRQFAQSVCEWKGLFSLPMMVKVDNYLGKLRSSFESLTGIVSHLYPSLLHFTPPSLPPSHPSLPSSILPPSHPSLPHTPSPFLHPPSSPLAVCQC